MDQIRDFIKPNAQLSGKIDTMTPVMKQMYGWMAMMKQTGKVS